MRPDLLDPPVAQPIASTTRTPRPESTRRERRRATLALLLACLVWGGSFTWAKSAIDATNAHAAAAPHSILGPMLLIAWRFLLAGIAWMLIFPKSRRGWSRRTVGRSILLGVIFGAGMIAQQWGLAYTSEAVSAFLTSLSILFIPLLLTLVIRKPPAPTLWLGIALATLGIWLMTGATPNGFGVGELLGLSCSLIFSSYLFVMNAAVDRDDPWRIAGGQFIAIGVICGIACLVLFPSVRRLDVLIAPLRRDVLPDLLLLMVFSTLGGFGLMTFYQPKLDPSRAALIYLLEPIFAAAYAFVFAGRGLSATACIGAGLILAANGLAEWIEARKKPADINVPVARPV